MASSRKNSRQLTESSQGNGLDRLNRLWEACVQSRIFRVLLVTVTGIFLSYSYRTVNQFFAPKFDFALPIDNQIPFVPWTGLIYWSYYGLFVGGAWVIDAALFTRAWVGVLVCNLASYVAYAFFTAYVPHPDVSFVQPDWLGDLYRGFYLLDDPGNTLPSLHCALSALLGWNIRKHNKLWLVWAVAISISTLTTKEHVFLDLIGGWLLAAVVQLTIVRPEPDEPEPSDETRDEMAAVTTG